MVEELQARLSALSLSPEQFVTGLPAPVRRRVEALRELQEQHGGLEEQYQKEREELDAKYAKLYAPLYDDRAAIVAGTKAPPLPAPAEGLAAEAGADTLAVEDAGADGPGIPCFWQIILLRCDVTRDVMNEKDADVLKYLKDVRSQTYFDDDASGFKLTFSFDENPYFTNKTLEKRYYLHEEGSEPVLERTEGTPINWKPGKNVTVKVMKKKPKKGSKPDAKPLTKTEPVDSFFNFFTPPQVPDNDDDLDEEELEALHEEIEGDYEMGALLREKLIPNAVKWFTGEALEEEGLMAYEDEDEDEDEGEDDGEGVEEDEDEEGDEDEEEEEERPAAGKRRGKQAVAAPASGEQPQECKQQ